MLLHQIPEPRGVVHFRYVAELVNDRVVDQFRRQEEELGVQGDGLPSRAARPTSLLPLDEDALVAKPRHAADGRKARNELLSRLAYEPAPYRCLAGMLVVSIAEDQKPLGPQLAHRY